MVVAKHLTSRKINGKRNHLEGFSMKSNPMMSSISRALIK
jgi:hypothetical protein